MKVEEEELTLSLLAKIVADLALACADAVPPNRRALLMEISEKTAELVRQFDARQPRR